MSQTREDRAQELRAREDAFRRRQQLRDAPLNALLEKMPPATPPAGRFGPALQAAREARNVSQTELGRRIGRVQSAISAWEKGKTAPDEPKLVAEIERALGVTPGELSRHLGFVPVAAPGRPRRVRTPEAIENDPDLEPWERACLMALYREIIAQKKVTK